MGHLEKSILCVVFFLTISTVLHAQQQLLYTQYMNNRIALNPAYAGLSEGLLNANLMSRWQWTGIEGAPRTSTLSIDGKLPNHNVGLGLQISQDRIAITDFTNIQASYSYHIKFGWRTKLSVGISGALINYRANYADAYVLQTGDPDFAANVSEMGANFGAGLYFTSNGIWAGFATPTILDNTFGDGQNGEFALRRHYYLMGGYKLDLNRNTTIMASFLFRAVRGGAPTVDINTQIIFYETLTLGVGYRADESLGFLFRLKPTSYLAFGYSYDFIIADELNDFINNSHEAMISIAIPEKKNKTRTSKKDETR